MFFVIFVQNQFLSNHKRNKESRKWRRLYWLMVFSIFVALILMVRFVLDSSKILVDKAMPINPYYIDWKLENDGLLRLNDPYYLQTRHKFIRVNLEKLKLDTSIYNPLILRSETGGSLRDIEPPYLLWKKANNDTIHILKNNILLDFKYTALE